MEAFLKADGLLFQDRNGILHGPGPIPIHFLDVKTEAEWREDWLMYGDKDARIETAVRQSPGPCYDTGQTKRSTTPQDDERAITYWKHRALDAESKLLKREEEFAELRRDLKSLVQDTDDGISASFSCI